MKPELEKELHGNTCSCGGRKEPGQVFCHWCYYGLPERLQAELFGRTPEKYEEAYLNAVKYLRKFRQFE